MYVLANKGNIKKFPYSPEQLSIDVNGTFPWPIPESLLAEFNVYPVDIGDPPKFNDSLEYADIVGCEYDDADNKYKAVWRVRDLTEEELDSRVPSIVSMSQFRKALFLSGDLFSVNVSFDRMEADRLTQIDWEYATEVDRRSSLIEYIKEVLMCSDAKIAEIFHLASTL